MQYQCVSGTITGCPNTICRGLYCWEVSQQLSTSKTEGPTQAFSIARPVTNFGSILQSGPLGMFIQVMPGQSCNSLHNVRNLYSTFIPHSTVIFKTPTGLSKWQILLLIKYFYPASHQTYVEPSKQGKQRFVVLFFAMYKLKYMQMCTIYTDDATIAWYLTYMRHSVMECFPSCLGS